MKRVYLCLVALLMTGFSTQVFAAYCQAVGGTKSFDFNYVTTISEPTANVPGTKAWAKDWALSGDYAARCNCYGNTITPLFYRTISTLAPVPVGTHVPDVSKKWFIIPNDKGDSNLAISTQVYIGGNLKKLVNVPFSDVSNIMPSTWCQPHITLATGAQGNISLTFLRPFIGQVVIPRVKVIDLFAGTNTSGDSFTGAPVASVYIQGTVTAIQSCKINDGQVIEVPFGQIAANDFRIKGAGPTGYTNRIIDVKYKCTNIANGVDVVMTLEAATSPQLPNAILTNNPDVGIMVYHNGNNEVIPHQTPLPITIKTISGQQTGSTTLFAKPVNTTGKLPQRGPFEATASLNINIK